MTKQKKINHRDLVEKWIKPTNGSPYITVILKPGRAFEPDREEAIAVHKRAFGSSKSAVDALRAARPCNCDRCACPKKRGTC